MWIAIHETSLKFTKTDHVTHESTAAQLSSKRNGTAKSGSNVALFDDGECQLYWRKYKKNHNWNPQRPQDFHGGRQRNT